MALTIVAIFGLLINLVSALILGGSQEEDAEHTHEDHNLKKELRSILELDDITLEVNS